MSSSPIKETTFGDMAGHRNRTTPTNGSKPPATLLIDCFSAGEIVPIRTLYCLLQPATTFRCSASCLTVYQRLLREKQTRTWHAYATPSGVLLAVTGYPRRFFLYGTIQKHENIRATKGSDSTQLHTVHDRGTNHPNRRTSSSHLTSCACCSTAPGPQIDTCLRALCWCTVRSENTI